MNPRTEDQEASYNSAYNPFPEPQTIPSGWDLSGLMPTPPIVSDTQVAESSETESE